MHALSETEWGKKQQIWQLICNEGVKKWWLSYAQLILSDVPSILRFDPFAIDQYFILTDLRLNHYSAAPHSFWATPHRCRSTSYRSWATPNRNWATSHRSEAVRPVPHLSWALSYCYWAMQYVPSLLSFVPSLLSYSTVRPFTDGATPIPNELDLLPIKQTYWAVTLPYRTLPHNYTVYTIQYSYNWGTYRILPYLKLVVPVYQIFLNGSDSAVSAKKMFI